MRAAKAAAVEAALVEDADEIDHGIGAAERIRELAHVVDVERAHVDAVGCRKLMCTPAAATEYRDLPAVLPQPRHEPPADETGAAEHHDATRAGCHGTSPRVGMDAAASDGTAQTTSRADCGEGTPA